MWASCRPMPDGYNQLYKAQRKPAPILEAVCWSRRRKFVDLVKQGEAPIASEAGDLSKNM